MSFSGLVRRLGPIGGYAMARQLTRDHPRILMYHRFCAAPTPGRVSAAVLHEQARLLARHHHPMSLTQLAAILRAGETPPPDTIVFTIDDGYRDFHDVAWPILREHGVPATFFVTTGFVDGALWLWPDQIGWLLDHAETLPERLASCGIALDAGARQARSAGAAWQLLIDHLLAQSDTRKHELIALLAAELGLTLPARAPDDYAPVSWDQLRRMQDEGLDIGGHTHTHPTLPKVAAADLPGELDHCLARLDAELGTRPRTFCYPNGQPVDYSAAVAAAVERAGFTCAVVAHADAARHDDLYALRRHVGSENMFQFHKSVSGLEWFGHRLRAGRRAA